MSVIRKGKKHVAKTLMTQPQCCKQLNEKMCSNNQKKYKIVNLIIIKKLMFYFCKLYNYFNIIFNITIRLNAPDRHDGWTDGHKNIYTCISFLFLLIHIQKTLIGNCLFYC